MTLVHGHQVTVKAFPGDAPESREETSNELKHNWELHLGKGLSVHREAWRTLT